MSFFFLRKDQLLVDWDMISQEVSSKTTPTDSKFVMIFFALQLSTDVSAMQLYQAEIVFTSREYHDSTLPFSFPNWDLELGPCKLILLVALDFPVNMLL